jgi:thiol-disulfide isomerase/thioredoxin
VDNNDASRISTSTFIPKKVLGKFVQVSDQQPKQSGGKSLIFFMGAGFCPFCASERWAIVKALNNFGAWQTLVETASADHDEKYLNIPTLDFSKAKYTSEYVDFVARETVDRNFEPLQELDEKDYEILDTFNPDQIIPFLLIDGRFMQVGSGYSPQLLEGMDHAKVKAEVENLTSSLGKAIKTETDNITALICRSIGGRANICNLEEIKTLTKKF